MNQADVYYLIHIIADYQDESGLQSNSKMNTIE